MKNIVIDVIGSFSDGKTTLVKALTNETTLRHSEEAKYGMTIRLGYAHFTIYKNKSSFSLKEGEPYMNVSIIDSPGHQQLLSIMISGASIVDGAILVVAANKNIQMQAIEHLQTIKKIGIKNLVVAQSKIDIVSKERAIESYKEIRALLDKEGYNNARIIPVFAAQNINIEEILSEIAKFEKPEEEGNLIMPIVRSFDVNRPGTKISKIKGAVIGGGIKRGKLKVGDKVKILPAVNFEGKEIELHSEVEEIQSEFGEEKEVERGKTIGVLTKLDPSLSRNDELAGRVLVSENEEIEYTNKISLEGEVKDLEKDETVLLHILSMRFAGRIINKKENLVEIALDRKIPYFKGETALVSKRINNTWVLVTGLKCK